MVQVTLRSAQSFTGVGLHSGRSVRMTLHPASAGYGIWFRRTDVSDRDPLVAARWSSVDRAPLCTRIVNAAGVGVSTVEHVMAALAGCGIHNALIEIDAAEVPILDGSAARFVQAIMARGVRPLVEAVPAIVILRRVRVEDGAASAELAPAATPEMSFTIDFADAAIGHQSKHVKLANGSFVRELCDSRTFCRYDDVHTMRAQGLALGGTYDNAVVVDGANVLTPGGLRHADEAVRHKMLDAMGDLALAGAPIFGHYYGVRAGHALTNRLLHRLFASPEAYRVVDCSPEMARRLPGVGVSRADLAAVA